MSLERAKSAPLEIYLHTTLTRGGLRFSDLLIPHIQNTKSLRAAYLSDIEFKGILPNFPQSMPNLQSLALPKVGVPGGSHPLIRLNRSFLP
jgi:hypothetical protein